ncbi:hypothetical protein VTO42DRAFT_5348 [Malbranchea cinnamomea]
MLTDTLPYGEAFAIMADGLNEARALRVVEILNDFRTLQLHISQLKSDAPRGGEREEGYVLMNQCVAEAQQLLTAEFSPDAIQQSGGNGEAEKIQLQRIIVDASCRRFQAHKIYLRMAAARRWEISRMQVLQGQRPGHQHTEALAAVNQTLREELSGITDSYVINDLRSSDMRAGHWLDDDPPLSTILNRLQSQLG